MSKMLLLADDSVVIQKLVGLSFANEDVEIVTTDNGDDAVVKAREIKPDVVLADVVMPGKSGYEVCEAIKQDPALAHIPVLLLTGTFEAFDESRATTAGANGQITKPFEAQALVERVNEVMNAPVSPAAAVSTTREPTPLSMDASTADYDFFDPNVATLSAEDSGSSMPLDTSSTDRTPAIEADNAQLFGAPGEGATDELETQVGGLALGESVSPGMIPEVPDSDATIAILPDSPPPLPPSAGDPLIGFEEDLGLADLINAAPTAPPISVDLDSALDAVPSDPGATIVAAIDDTNAATFPNHDDEGMIAIDDDIDDLTVHTPSSAIDHDVASAPSPVAIGSLPLSGRADATVVADLDISLAEPVPEATSPPPPTPAAPQPLDIGPSNVSPEELDFAFDVSEQVPAGDLGDSFGEAFSSLMDISESQILSGPQSDLSAMPDAPTMDTIVDDSFAAGYDVSSSDLATAAPPTHDVSARTEAVAGIEDSIALDLQGDLQGGLQDSLQNGPHDAVQDHLQEDAQEILQEYPRYDLGAEREEQAADAAATPLSPEGDDLELGIATPTSNGSDDRIADLSPLVEQRIQETLEKVAWEAFSDLSESIVKQVLDRVEKIAWEVIPQMAETLVREEIRKMKGEKD